VPRQDTLQNPQQALSVNIGSGAPGFLKAVLKTRAMGLAEARWRRKQALTNDHVLSITDGGGDGAMNMVMACRSCNSRRGDIVLGQRLGATDFASLPEVTELCRRENSVQPVVNEKQASDS